MGHTFFLSICLLPILLFGYGKADWKEAAPYLLPSTHPSFTILEEIFDDPTTTHSIDSLEQAGFSPKPPGKFSRIVVARHPKLKGYLTKFFIGEVVSSHELEKLATRAQGAILARNIINIHHYEKWFKVPYKWLYAPPHNPSGIHQRFILLVEDMQILPKHENYGKWKEVHSYSFLEALFVLLTEGGFSDSVHVFNIPFCRDGRVALIDTEYSLHWPISYHQLNRYLGAEGEKVWNSVFLK